MTNKLSKEINTGIELVKEITLKNSTISKLELSLKISDTISKPIIRTVFKDNGSTAFTFVTILVKRFIDSFGFSTKMTPLQIEMLTVDTLDKFNYETIEDLIIFFKMCRSGRFGTTKRGVDSNLIFGEWFPLYLELKSEEREKIIEDNKHKTNEDRRGATEEDVNITYNNIKKLNLKKHAQEYVDKISENMDRQLLEDTILDWSKYPERKIYLNLLKLKRKTIKL